MVGEQPALRISKLLLHQLQPQSRANTPTNKHSCTRRNLNKTHPSRHRSDLKTLKHEKNTNYTQSPREVRCIRTENPGQPVKRVRTGRRAERGRCRPCRSGIQRAPRRRTGTDPSARTAGAARPATFADLISRTVSKRERRTSQGKSPNEQMNQSCEAMSVCFRCWLAKPQNEEEGPAERKPSGAYDMVKG